MTLHLGYMCCDLYKSERADYIWVTCDVVSIKMRERTTFMLHVMWSL